MDPLIYIGKLLCSIFAALIALSFVVLIIMTFMENMGLRTDSVNPIENMGNTLQDGTDGSDSTSSMLLFLCLSHFFVFLAFFFINATVVGNTTMGERFATFTFYPMEKEQTLLNSFLANTAYKNMVCTGVK